MNDESSFSERETHSQPNQLLEQEGRGQGGGSASGSIFLPGFEGPP